MPALYIVHCTEQHIDCTETKNSPLGIPGREPTFIEHESLFRDCVVDSFYERPELIWTRLL